MRRLTVLLMVLGLTLMALPLAQAALVPVLPIDYTGSRTVGDGHTLGGGAYLAGNGFTISWNIVTNIPGEPGEFEYNYTISGAGGLPAILSSPLKNLFLQVSPGDPRIEIPETRPLGSLVGDPVVVGAPFHSLYWTTLNDNSLLVHYDSLREPVWGSFYADNGLASPNYAYAQNGDFPSFMDSAGFHTILDYIPVADTVPVPPAVWLFGSGLVGLFGLRRKFGK